MDPINSRNESHSAFEEECNDERRKALLATFQEHTGETVPSETWGLLWLSDIENLQGMVDSIMESTFDTKRSALNYSYGSTFKLTTGVCATAVSESSKLFLWASVVPLTT